MRGKNILWFNSAFTRLIVTFVLVIFPLYFLGMQIFQWSRGMLTTEIFDYNQAQVAFYLDNLTTSIKHVKELQFNCFTDNNLNDLVNAASIMSDFDKTQAINRLRQRLDSIKGSVVFVQNVKAYIPSISRVINAYGNTGPSGKLEGSISELNMDDYATVGDMPSDTGSQILYRDNRLIINATSSSKYIGNLPAFVIEIELSKDTLRNILIQSGDEKGEETLLMSPTQKFVVTSDKDAANSRLFQDLVMQRSATQKSGALSVEVKNKKFMLIYATSDYLGVVLAKYIPEETVFRSLGIYQNWFMWLSVLSFLVIAGYSFATYRFIQKPLGKLVKAFGRVQEGDFNVEVKYVQKDEFGFLYTGFNNMVNNIKRLIDQVYYQKILAQRAELKQLQSQINPHFLYNSFFILQRRINKGDYDNAEKFCENLGNYFRFITRSASDIVPLEKEVEHARIYAGIQAMRFSNRITVDFGEIPSGWEQFSVPRLILQPIIENAFEHGLEEKESDGQLRISFAKSGSALLIAIEDNGEKLTDEDLNHLASSLEERTDNAETTGILNIHQRIRLALGGSSGLKAARGEMGGLRIEINLDAREE